VTLDLLAEREEIWVASVAEDPDALGAKLSVLAESGADLEFILVRRSLDEPGKFVVFVSPLRGDREWQAATQSGFELSTKLYSVRVEGPNEAGLASRLTSSLGQLGIKLRGMSAAVLGTKMVIHFALGSADDQKAVIKLLSEF
jgi:hypothetical protein